MMHKAWRSIEEVPYRLSRSSVNFQGHAGQKIANFCPNWVFPDCNSSLNIPTGLKSPILTRFPGWIHRWIWNDAKSLMQYRRGALLFFEVIHQISRSHGLINRWFESNLSKISRPVAAIKSLRFALFSSAAVLHCGAYCIPCPRGCFT